MPIIASDKGGGDYQIPPEGNHLAICVWVIDLGTQQVESFSNKTVKVPQRRVWIAWELPEEKSVFDEDKGEESFMISKEYTLSLNEKATLRHHLESWRGRAFTEEELEGFDITKLLGAAAMVSVVHATAKQSQRKYAKVTTVTKLPKSIKKDSLPKPSIPLVQYAIEDEESDAFHAMPEFLRNKILASEEAKGAPKKANNGGRKVGDAPEAEEPDDPF